MGGCCSIASRSYEVERTPTYLYCPQASHEHAPASFTRGTTSAITLGLLVDTNLETSSPDTYRAPPAPLPYDVGLVCSQTSPASFGACEDVKEPGFKDKSDSGHGSPKVIEDEPSKPITSTMEEEDVCPTCLEEYDLDNPRIITKCEHHFHLSCILEWMERKDTCPICEKIMIFDQNFDD